jgi:hypothetical protein
MAIAADKTQDVPMSVRMRRVLTAVKRMPSSDRVQLLVKAGLMTESEAQQAVGRLTLATKVRRKPKGHRAESAKKAAEPGKP